TSVAVLMSLASDTPTAVIELNPRVPPELSELVMQLLERVPSKRPGSAAEVVERLEAIENELQGFSEGPATSAAQVPDTQVLLPVNGASKKKKRKPAGIGVAFWIGAFVVFAFVGIGIGTVAIALRATLFADRPIEPKRPIEKPVEIAPPLAGNVTSLKELPEVRRENYPFQMGPEEKGL